MPVIPGQVMNSMRYEIPNGQTDNSFANNFMQVAAQMLAMRQQRQQAQQNQFANIFPTLASHRMLTPAKPGDPNYIGQMGNMQFGYNTNPPPDWDTLNAQALYESRTNPQLTPSAAMSVLLNSQAGLEALTQNPEATVEQIKKIQEAWNKMSRKELPGSVSQPKGKIRVKRKKDGKTGTIDEDEFDSKVYIKL